MVATGIARKPEEAPEWEFRYYQRGELDGAPLSVRTHRMATDATDATVSPECRTRRGDESLNRSSSSSSSEV